MRSALFLPPFGPLADARLLAAVARDAEDAGWDGVFLWDHVTYRAPVTDVADPWTCLAAMAMTTERVLLGPMVTPVARRRPHVLARQTATLDRLSGGRLVLGVGLGLDGSGRELSAFREQLDDRTRARMLDEALDVLAALWSGERVDHRGTHYDALDVRFLPTPAQRPRVPVWVAGRWPNRAPLRRAARWDGYFPIDLGGPDDVAAAVDAVAAERPAAGAPGAGFDVAVTVPPGSDPSAWRDAGATWVLHAFGAFDLDLDAVRALACEAPPGGAPR